MVTKTITNDYVDSNIHLNLIMSIGFFKCISNKRFRLFIL